MFNASLPRLEKLKGHKTAVCTNNEGQEGHLVLSVARKQSESAKELDQNSFNHLHDQQGIGKFGGPIHNVWSQEPSSDILSPADNTECCKADMSKAATYTGQSPQPELGPPPSESATPLWFPRGDSAHTRIPASVIKLEPKAGPCIWLTLR